MVTKIKIHEFGPADLAKMVGDSITVGTTAQMNVGMTYIGDFPPSTFDDYYQPIKTAPSTWMPWRPVDPYVVPYRKVEDDYERAVERAREFKELLEKANKASASAFRFTAGDRGLLAIDLPGVRRNAIELVVDGFTVKVKARREDLKTTLDASYTVPNEYDVDPESIEAWHEDGVLTIAFNKRAKGPVKIGIK